MSVEHIVSSGYSVMPDAPDFPEVSEFESPEEWKAFLVQLQEDLLDPDWMPF